MTIANVALTNTFDEWRTRTNQLAFQSNKYAVDIIDLNNRIILVNTSVAYANSLANTVNVRVTSATLGINAYWQSTMAGANAVANLYTQTVGLAGNSYSRTVGLAGNSYTQTVGLAGNSYTQTVGLAGNSYTQTVGLAGNSYTQTVGLAGNSYTQYVGLLANTNAANASYMSTGTVLSARLSGSYTGITGIGTITTGTWQGTTLAVAYGGTGATNESGARTNLGVGNNATRNVMITTTATTPSGGNNGDIWIQYIA
jgi:hypothetical protein